jgi:glutathione S-transferase
MRALRLKGVPFTLVEPRSPLDFRRWNPQTAKMPVLEMEGRREYDSTFILRWLDEVIPAPRLEAQDPDAAARQRFVEDWSDESLYWYAMALRWTPANADATADQVLATLPLPTGLHPLLRPVLRWQIGGQAAAQGLQRLPLERILEELARRFDELLALLDDTPFLFAREPSRADLAVVSQVRLLESGPTPQGAALVAARPALAAYAARVDAAAPV